MKSVIYRIWNQVGLQAGSQVKDQVEHKVRIQVWFQLKAQVGDQVRFQVRHKVMQDLL